MFAFLKNLFGGDTNRVDVQALVQSGNATLIDVRTPAEFKAGHPRNAVNIPLNTLQQQLPRIQKMKQPIVTCCASGMRSGQAVGVLRQAGLEAHNGGGWQNFA